MINPDCAGFGVCPVCNCRTLESGDFIDFTQVDPDRCQWCGYVQPGHWERPDLVDFIAKCWELQVYPWGNPPQYVTSCRYADPFAHYLQVYCTGGNGRLPYYTVPEPTRLFHLACWERQCLPLDF